MLAREIFHFFLLSEDFFKFRFNSKLFQKILSGILTIRVTNSLDPDQDRHSVGPDLGPNFLQGLSAGDESRRQQGTSQGINLFSIHLQTKHQLHCEIKRAL